MNYFAESKTVTYRDVIHIHHDLDIDFDQTIALIKHWFPQQLESAIALWNALEAQRLGVNPHA